MQFKDRWTEVRSGVLSDETIMNYIDSVVAVLDAPQQRNFTQWPILSQYIWPNNYVGGSYANEVDYLKNWIGNRMSWLDSQIYAFELVTDLGEPLLSENNISVFPNPGNGNFSIKFDKIPAHSIQVSLHNQLGQELLNKTMDIHENTMTLSDLENQLPDGVYVMRISDDNNIVTTKKLIVYQ